MIFIERKKTDHQNLGPIRNLLEASKTNIKPQYKAICNIMCNVTPGIF